MEDEKNAELIRLAMNVRNVKWKTDLGRSVSRPSGSRLDRQIAAKQLVALIDAVDGLICMSDVARRAGDTRQWAYGCKKKARAGSISPFAAERMRDAIADVLQDLEKPREKRGDVKVKPRPIRLLREDVAAQVKELLAAHPDFPFEAVAKAAKMPTSWAVDIAKIADGRHTNPRYVRLFLVAACSVLGIEPDPMCRVA